MAKLDEFNSPKENLGADPQREFDAPAERYGPGQPEYVPPETPDGIPVRKKKTSRMLITAIMSLSLLTAPVLDEAAASHAQSAPQPSRPAAVEETLPSSTDQPPQAETPVTQPPETEPPETEPEKTDLEILLEVGTWVSEDGLLYARFDEGGNGWWRTAKNGNTYARMAWQEQDGHVDYSGHAVSAQLVTYSDGEMARAFVKETVEGTVAVSGMTIEMQNPFGMEASSYVPAGAVEIAQPYEHLDPELPGTGWQMAEFSTVPEEVAEAEKMPNRYLSYCVWITGAHFEAETCTVSFADNFNGSRTFSFTWREEGEDELVLTPTAQMEYVLRDASENSTTSWDNGTNDLHVYLAAGESGPVLCVQNPFANRFVGLDYEFLSMS